MPDRENYTILVLEDDPSFLLDLEMMLEEMGFSEPSAVKSAEKALVYLKDNNPDLILADVHLEGELTGIDFAELIKNKEIPIIFLTSFHDAATFEKARPSQPIAFLGKPVDKLMLESTIQLVLDRRLGNALSKATDMEKASRFDLEDFIFIRSNTNLEKVKVRDILYIHSDGNYCYIFVENKKYVLKVSLVNLAKKLPEKAFLRIHRSYLVRQAAIAKIETKANVVYVGKERLPLGRSYKKEVFEQLNLFN